MAGRVAGSIIARMQPFALARLVPLACTTLPDWCDRFLSPPGSGEFFSSRAWYDTLLSHARPEGTEPILAVCGDDVLLPLARSNGRLSGLVSPYTLDWRPVCPPGTGAATLHEAGTAFGRLLRLRAPCILDTLDAQAPEVAPFLTGLAAGRLVVDRFRHTGNWHEAIPSGLGWDAYFAGRPAPLRTTISRKLSRAAKHTTFNLVTRPGAELEAGITDYEAVRARSWKPHEPFPSFDGALMRRAAALGALRLGILRERAGGLALAAQYWVLDRGGARALLLKLAHAEDSRAASPGTVLTALMVRHLLQDDSVTELDLGRGDDAYKQLWVGKRRQRIGVVVADPLHPAGLLQLARQAAGRLRRRVRRGVEPTPQVPADG